MTALSWDEIGDRLFEVGLDRGVLYLADLSGVAWNGLTSVTEKFVGDENVPVYFDGARNNSLAENGDFSATLKAFTYPEEFMQFEGNPEFGTGFRISNQGHQFFSLSYRTLKGNDVDGQEHGYYIHILYNLLATPSQKNYGTLDNDGSLIEFEWTISSVPPDTPGFRPTSHIVLDSTDLNPLVLAEIEGVLYGTEDTEAHLWTMEEFIDFINGWAYIKITDNGDGTWTATGPDALVSMLDLTTFQIISGNAFYLDGDTYIISSTIPEGWGPWAGVVVTDNGDGTATITANEGFISYLDEGTAVIDGITVVVVDDDELEISDTPSPYGC